MNDEIFFKTPAHGRVVNWLGPQMVGKLLEYAQSHRDSFCESRVWNTAKGKSERDPTVRRSWRTRNLGSLRDEIELRARQLLPDMYAQLGIERSESHKFDIEMVAHCDGAFYGEHRDWQPRSSLSRRLISAVYYFHRLPKSFSGGALRVYPIAGAKNSTAFIEIEPINDTLVFFPSWFPHEVLPVNCPSIRFEDSRFAINCWLHC
ncbi:MAG: 2OG-Fe(II) oxygenase [Rhizobiales bacterium]|nr:2OG-Fe(II) oxygenase [Hyphomicrobiales bacterium]